MIKFFYLATILFTGTICYSQTNKNVETFYKKLLEANYTIVINNSEIEKELLKHEFQVNDCIMLNDLAYKIIEIIKVYVENSQDDTVFVYGLEHNSNINIALNNNKFEKINCGRNN